MGSGLTKERVAVFLRSPEASRVTMAETVVLPAEPALFDRVFSWAGAGCPSGSEAPISEPQPQRCGPSDKQSRHRADVAVSWCECGDLGSRRTVLVFGGIGSSRLIGFAFDEAARARGLRVVCVDPPGVGGSGALANFSPSSSSSRTTAENWRALMRSFLATLCGFSTGGESRDSVNGLCDRLDIVGFSAGGLLASLCAGDPWISERSCSYVLLAPWVPPSWPGAPLHARAGAWVPGPVLSTLGALVPLSTRLSVAHAPEAALKRKIQSVSGNGHGGNGPPPVIGDGAVDLFRETIREASHHGNGGFGRLLDLCLERHETIPRDECARGLRGKSQVQHQDQDQDKADQSLLQNRDHHGESTERVQRTVLVVAGGEDGMAPPEAVRKGYVEIFEEGEVEFVVLEGANHDAVPFAAMEMMFDFLTSKKDNQQSE